MFSVKHVIENGFDKLRLEENSGSVYCEVVPACGATLHAFGAKNGDRIVQVIEHYESAEQFEKEVEVLGFRGCKLSPYVCRLRNSGYTFGGKDYVIRNNAAQHAIHGLLYKKSFKEINIASDEHHATVVLSYHFDKEDEGYPFTFDCFVSYELRTGNYLHVTTKYINRTNEPIPVQDGWHPYFSLGGKTDDLEMQFHSKNKLIFDEHLMPTGARVKDDTYDTLSKIGHVHLDNCFELDQSEKQPRFILRNPANGVEVQILPEDSYPYLQIYTPAHRNSIAVENLSGPPNGLNLGFGFAILNKNEEISFDAAYKISFLN